MRESRLPSQSSGEPSSHMITAGGWARSGKGTSMAHLKTALEIAGQKVELIDQGLKFRGMAEVAINAGESLDSPRILDDFIRSRQAQKATLAVLDEVSGMDETAKKARLYTSVISKASGKIGKVPSAHVVAIGLLRSQVHDAVEAKADIILIDGRSMEKYARQFTEDGLAKFVMGWYFKCDPAIAARRSLGMFDELEALSPDDRTRLLAETLNISDRNRSDTLRDVDPMREPMYAYHLDLPTYSMAGSDVPYKRGHDILRRAGVAVVDTSYTNSIQEMTGPVTELSMLGLYFRGPLLQQDVGINIALTAQL